MDVERVLEGLNASGLVQAGGVCTTAVNTSQQWDLPNAWAPLQLMLIEGLNATGSAEAQALAQTLGCRWLRTNYRAWAASGFMYEKYDCLQVGHGGGGGEYKPQIGFGWSNGVALALLRALGPAFTARCGERRKKKK